MERLEKAACPLVRSDLEHHGVGPPFFFLEVTSVASAECAEYFPLNTSETEFAVSRQSEMTAL